MTERFRQFVSARISLRAADWDLICACLQVERYPAGAYLLQSGQVCRHLYFLNQGLLRFFIWIDGEDKTKFFTYENLLFTSQQSFSLQQPATENIQALEPCEVLAISWEDLQRLYREVPDWSVLIRRVLQEVNGWTEDLSVSVRYVTAEKRYQHLMETEPELVQRIPLKYLASYLGIAPQSISRIRRQLLRRK